jgi:flagellar hook-length control protein FliK
MLGLGGQTGAPERSLTSTHADRARSANPADERLTKRSDRGEGGSVGFGQELKNQLRERHERPSGAAAPEGEELPEGGKASPAATDANASPLEAATMAGLLPLPVQPHALDAAGLGKPLFAEDDRFAGGAERGSQRGLIAMLQRHPGAVAGASEQMPASLRALASALAADSGAPGLACAAPADSRSMGEGVTLTQAPAAQAAATAQAATPTSPPLVATPTDPARIPVLDVDPPVGHPAWRESVGHHVTWMVDQGIGRAELRLHPAHLGPIEVKVSVQNDHVNVSFHASHAATREALESSLPRLRELLGDSGLSLGQASVSQQFAGGERAPERTAPAHRGDALHVDSSAPHIEAQVTTRVRLGLLDAYA